MTSAHPRWSGSSTHAGGVFTINGGGNDIWGDADQFQFVHQSLTGDGEIVARVTARKTPDDWAKSGVMIKQSTTAGSPYALLAVTPEHGVNVPVQLQRQHRRSLPRQANAWLKLKRAGDMITGFVSADGQTWTEIGSATVDLDGDAVDRFVRHLP